jgi:transglutaminase-like putative cysteine protease
LPEWFKNWWLFDASSMDYQITHTTTYEYSSPVSLCQNLAHLTPREVPGQFCRETDLLVLPQPAIFSKRIDFFGNPMTFFAVQEPHRKLTVTASHRVERSSGCLPEPSETPAWEDVRDRLTADHRGEALDAYQFVFASRYARPSAELTQYALASFPSGRPLLEAALDLMRRIHRDFVYDPRATTVATPLHEVLSRKRGVCQDFAHLQIACLRGLGLAARYVSGYLLTQPPSETKRLRGADATHAWLAVYCPGSGWVDLDPTNDQIPTDRHIVLAWGRDYDDVSPIKGVILGGGQHTVRVVVEVVRTGENE